MEWTAPQIPSVCLPAEFFLTVSCIILVSMFLVHRYMMNGRNLFCLGTDNCSLPDMTMMLTIKFLYIFFWTWLLNLICNRVDPSVSWFLALIPFVLFFGMSLYWLVDQNVAHQWYLNWHK